MKKEIAYIGLGKMGKNMVLRLLEHGWRVHVFDTDQTAVREVVKMGARHLASLQEISRLPKPRLVWVMVPAFVPASAGKPAGKPVDDVLFGRSGLTSILKKGDVVIDGGNSFFEDTLRRAKKVQAKKIEFMDIGTSGGPRGARNGACLMIGGDKKLFIRLKPLFEDLAAPHAYAHCGKAGSGHFVKMIHNGIEYGMMQAIAEGFNLMKHSSFKPNLKAVAELYNHKSVVESRLIGWLKEGFDIYGENLQAISGTVGATGEGE